jgi:hypothetical protein
MQWMVLNHQGYLVTLELWIYYSCHLLLHLYCGLYCIISYYLTIISILFKHTIQTHLEYHSITCLYCLYTTIITLLSSIISSIIHSIRDILWLLVCDYILWNTLLVMIIGLCLTTSIWYSTYLILLTSSISIGSYDYSWLPCYLLYLDSLDSLSMWLILFYLVSLWTISLLCGSTLVGLWILGYTRLLGTIAII